MRICEMLYSFWCVVHEVRMRLSSCVSDTINHRMSWLFCCIPTAGVSNYATHQHWLCCTCVFLVYSCKVTLLLSQLSTGTLRGTTTFTPRRLQVCLVFTM